MKIISQKNKNRIEKIFLGNTNLEKTASRPYYETQKQNLKSIWNNTKYNDFGVERLLRIFLQLLAWPLPSGILRSLTGSDNFLTRRLSIEILVIAKLIFYYFVLKFDYTSNFTILVIAFVLTCDTIYFSISRIMLNDLYRKHVSYTRSLLLTFLNYIEVCLFFAILYLYIDYTRSEAFIINENIQLTVNGHLSSIQAIYFSFITAATIGYGDISPKDPFAMKIVVIQTIVSLFFVIVFLTNVINQLGKNTFYNQVKNTEEENNPT